MADRGEVSEDHVFGREVINPRHCCVGFFLVFAAGPEALMVWVSFHHRTSPRDF